MNELVTVVITTYKRPPEIVNRAIQSVLMQTYPHIELIVVDDSPSNYELRDDIARLVTGIDGNVQYIQHEKNMGACAARNTGLKNAHGVYISFLDDDDELIPDKTEKQVKLFTDDNVGLVYCGSKRCFVDTGKIETRPSEHFSRGYVFDDLITKGNFIGGSGGPLIRTDYMISCGAFDELMQASQDYDMWLRITKEYKVDYIDEPLYIFYIRSSNERISNNIEKKLNGTLRLIEKNNYYLNTHRKAWYSKNIVLCNCYSKNSQLTEAKHLWWQCVKKCPENIKTNMRTILKILYRSLQ